MSPMMPQADRRGLAVRLAERIAREGPLDFAEFMRACLYDPDAGYYAAGSSPFGAGGDFITAPELTPLFGRSLARLLAPVLRRLRRPVLRELGPGSGALIAALLPALEALEALPEWVELVEPSRARREEQRARLAGLPAPLAARLVWTERPQVTAAEGVVVANEVLDALPVRRFLLSDEGLFALAVDFDGRRFRWRAVPADSALARAVEDLLARLPEPLPRPYTSELCPGLAEFLRIALAGIERGAALFIDYGYPRREYYHPLRRMGTLVAHRGHRPSPDPLSDPGAQDLSAFVDFSALAEALEALQWTAEGFLSQAECLIGAGLLEELAALPARGGAYHAAAAAVKRLILPGEMGERFRVLLAARGMSAPFPQWPGAAGLERL